MEATSRFMDNLEYRQRIRGKLDRYATFTKETPFDQKQSLLNDILGEYKNIDPYPLAEQSLGALNLLKRQRYIDLDPQDYIKQVMIEFNLEYHVLKPNF
ncbi:MAG: hypothetical protein K2X95_01485 [Flavobacteriaceae bacterium]|nr:hypothetical protein [Flavobacteriaceae bacterium]